MTAVIGGARRYDGTTNQWVVMKFDQRGQNRDHLTGVGITVLTTMEILQDRAELRFTPNVVSFLADVLLLLRYCESEGQIKKVMAVAKMRGSQHSKAFREYDVTGHGFEVGGGLEGFRGSISGAPYLTGFPE